MRQGLRPCDHALGRLVILPPGEWRRPSLFGNARGDASNRRLFVDRAAVGGGGDSLKIDHLGNMWTSIGNSLSVFDPRDKRLGVIRTDERISNCKSGADGHVYIASNTRLLRAKVTARKITRRNT